MFAGEILKEAELNLQSLRQALQRATSTNASFTATGNNAQAASGQLDMPSLYREFDAAIQAGNANLARSIFIDGPARIIRQNLEARGVQANRIQALIDQNIPVVQEAIAEYADNNYINNTQNPDVRNSGPWKRKAAEDVQGFIQAVITAYQERSQ